MTSNASRLSWRREYLRILDAGPKNQADFSPDLRDEEATQLRDLKDVGCISVQFTCEGWFWEGPNFAGLCLADKLRTELFDESPRRQLLGALGLALYWSFGVVSGVLVSVLISRLNAG